MSVKPREDRVQISRSGQLSKMRIQITVEWVINGNQEKVENTASFFKDFVKRSIIVVAVSSWTRPDHLRLNPAIAIY